MLESGGNCLAQGFLGLIQRDPHKGTRHETCRAEVEGDHLAVPTLPEVARMNIARAKTKAALRVGHYIDTPRVALVLENLSWP